MPVCRGDAKNRGFAQTPATPAPPPVLGDLHFQTPGRGLARESSEISVKNNGLPPAMQPPRLGAGGVEQAPHPQ